MSRKLQEALSMSGSERRVVAWSANVVHSALANPSAARKSDGRSRVCGDIAVWLGILVSVQPFNTRREFPIVYCWTLSDISKPKPQTSNRHERLELRNRLGASFG